MKNVQFKTRHTNILYTAIDTTKDPVMVIWVDKGVKKKVPIQHNAFHTYLKTGTDMATTGKKAIGNVRKKKSVNLFSIDEL